MFRYNYTPVALEGVTITRVGECFLEIDAEGFIEFKVDYDFEEPKNWEDPMLGSEEKKSDIYYKSHIRHVEACEFELMDSEDSYAVSLVYKSKIYNRLIFKKRPEAFSVYTELSKVWIEYQKTLV